MPEQSDNQRFIQQWRLSNAANVGQVVRISCGHCRIRRHYKPAELREVLGNRSVEEIRGGMRCEKCGIRDYIRAEFFHPIGEELNKLRFRRLKEIRFVRKVIWWDE